MKLSIKVRKDKWRGKGWTVWLVSGVQSFQLDYNGTKAECLWYGKMLKKMLKGAGANC